MFENKQLSDVKTWHLITVYFKMFSQIFSYHSDSESVPIENFCTCNYWQNLHQDSLLAKCQNNLYLKEFQTKDNFWSVHVTASCYIYNCTCTWPYKEIMTDFDLL